MSIKRTLKEWIPTNMMDRYAKLKYAMSRSKFTGFESDEVFSKIYKENLWGSSESASGPGSTVGNTVQLVLAMNHLIKELHIQSILDMPCGDFNWMKELDLSNIQYTGVDIVRELISQNITKYGGERIQFRVMDICKDRLPKADLILNRDCLVHFSYNSIHKALQNVISSGSTYLATTSFSHHRINFDITTGDWRPLNLQRDPFRFPHPWRYLEEHNAGLTKKEYKGKMLGIWKIKDLEYHLCSDEYKLN